MGELVNCVPLYVLQGTQSGFSVKLWTPKGVFVFLLLKFSSPGFPACKVGLQMKICPPMADTKASTPMQKKPPLIPRVVFKLVKKLFFLSNIFVAPLFDELLSDTLFMVRFLIFLSSWSFDGKAVWHTMWYVGSWCYCIYIVSFTVLSQSNFCEMHMTSSVRSVSQIL